MKDIRVWKEIIYRRVGSGFCFFKTKTQSDFGFGSRLQIEPDPV